ncbi:MAG: hypothetical protein JSU06_06500 [Actinobacteria bacterium]|nr:hypothetical protein [Actinomycetota bacterium]
MRRLLGTASAVAALSLTFFTGAARADFGLEAGSFFAKSHPTVPLLTIPQRLGYYEQREVDRASIQAASPMTQAGAHPDASAGFVFNQAGIDPEGNVKDVVVGLPAGFLGDPEAVPPCSRPAFVETLFEGPEACPPASQVGVVTLHVQGNLPLATVPVYRLTTAFGRPASFGFPVLGKGILLQTQLRSDGDYGLNVVSPDVSDFYPLRDATVTFWGVPADPIHDPERLNPRGISGGAEWGAGSEATQKPFLSSPTWCDSGPLDTTISVRSWQEPGTWLPTVPTDPGYNFAAPTPSGCAALRFGGSAAPTSFTFQPVLHAADTLSAYSATLTLPYNENPNGLANPTLRDTTVTLPEGVVANASSANGLAACTTQQIGYLGNEFPLPNPIRFDEEEPRCPDASKIGTVTIHTPLLEKALEGSVYLAKQGDNPFGSLLAIYLAVDDPQTGIVVKLAGKVTPDPQTGRLTATFEDNPQLPFTELELSFFGGPGASLANPPTCGTKTTTSVVTPWSAPYTPAVTSTDSFQVTSGPAGAPCVTSEGEMPNRPSLEAGTVSPLAGTYSPFVLRLSREDGSQRLAGLDLTLPPGLTGRLAGVPYCPESGITQAASRDKPGEGALEQASPSCPAASQVGTVSVAAGAGSQPVHVQGKAYLGGPYKGAPLSLVAITPAVAGPFDLGVVVVRTALQVNPQTARISARTDPLPTILEGIPLDIRQIAIELDRPGFTLNPTSCEAMSVTGQAISTTGAVAPLSNRFQVGGCKGLDFSPKLALRVFGKTGRNAKPRLRAVVQMKEGEANIARAQVNLPHSEFLEQNHLDKTCTRPVLTEGKCPASSVYGRAKAWTPLLEKPLEGNVYLVGGYGYKLPALVADLNGQIRVTLVGKVDAGPNQGIRNTFEVVPDAPVSKFMLELKGGRKGLLVNSEDLCAKGAKTEAIARFTGQNGAVRSFKPKVANDCASGVKGKGAKKKSKR